MTRPDQKYEWVFICSPYAGNIVENTRKALRYCKFAVENGKLPICPHVYFTRFMDDSNPVERSLGITYGLDMMVYCRQMWVFGRVTAGMQFEIDRAKDMGILIRRISDAEVDEDLRERGAEI